MNVLPADIETEALASSVKSMEEHGWDARSATCDEHAAQSSYQYSAISAAFETGSRWD